MKSSRTWLISGLILLFYIGFTDKSLGQNGDSHEDYYIFPIKPGVRNTLAGTMGELRSSHFHTGIDIRTGGVQGVPVQAAADGVISRIAVFPGGYGNALYILHPNGETTVYGHLKEFEASIQEYVRAEQYQRETFQLNLFPAKDKFKVSKGDTIALSGNSGSSGGPHLHFDIRDRNQNVLNPLEYNFEEIVDFRSPVVRKVALKTMDIDSRINNQFGRFEFDVKRNGTNWVVDSTIRVFGKIGVEIYAYDRQDGTRFRTGINQIHMKLDDENIFDQTIANIPFSKSRNFYYHVNYKSLRSTGERFHKLYVDDGNELDFYTTNALKGLMQFDETCDHTISIQMLDSYENESILTIPIACQSPGADHHIEYLDHTEINLNSFDIQDNTLIVYADQTELDSIDQTAYFYFEGTANEVNPAYTAENINIFLWDLRSGIPDSVDLCNSTLLPNIEVMLPSGIPFKFYSKYLEASLSERSLFDTVYLHSHHQKSFLENSELFKFGNEEYPIRTNIEVILKPSKIYSDQERTQVYYVDDSGNFSYIGGEWDDNKIDFRTNEFGDFTLLTDTIPPAVKPLIVNHDKLVFRIDDELSGINEFNMHVNDQWVLMDYDPKQKQIWSEKLDQTQPFEGSVVLSVIDNAGNEKIYTTNLKKYESQNR